MKCLIAISLLAAFCLTGRAEEGKPYEGYWLAPEQGHGYVDLLLTRRTVDHLAGFAQATNESLLESDAVIVTTYAQDSIWEGLHGSFKLLTDVESIDAYSARIGGRNYRVTPAPLEDVLELFEHPKGTIPVHRLVPQVDQKEIAAALKFRIQKQFQGAQANPAPFKISAVASTNRVRLKEPFKTTLRVENRSDTNLTLRVMNCSWDQHWRVSHRDLSWIGWDCSKNFAVDETLAPGEVYERSLEVVMQETVHESAFAFRMGFTSMNDTRTYWSEKVMIEVAQ
jgi:hypothetical protein